MDKELYILRKMVIVFIIVLFWTNILSLKSMNDHLWYILDLCIPIVKNILLFVYHVIAWLIVNFIELSNDKKIICIQNMIIVYLIQD